MVATAAATEVEVAMVVTAVGMEEDTAEEVEAVTATADPRAGSTAPRPAAEEAIASSSTTSPTAAPGR